MSSYCDTSFGFTIQGRELSNSLLSSRRHNTCTSSHKDQYPDTLLRVFSCLSSSQGRVPDSPCPQNKTWTCAAVFSLVLGCLSRNWVLRNASYCLAAVIV